MTSEPCSPSSSAFLAACVFISAVVVSQILQHKLQRKREKEQEATDLRKIYKMKRLADRLSYTDITALLPGPAGRSPRNSHKIADEDAYDDMPKNSNWCHFENCSELDLTEGVVENGEEDDDEGSTSSSSEAFLWTDASQAQRRRPSRHSVSSSPSHILRRSMSEIPPSRLFQRLKQTLGMDDSDFEPSSEDVEFSAMGLDEEDLVDVRKQRIQFKDIPGSRTIRRHASDPQVLQNADDKQFVLQSMHNREARAEYNATIMPNKVVMVRHGQSEGNTNEALYSTTPDNSMRLTKLGWEQAREAGRILKEKVLIPGEPIHFIVSPYVRTVETFHGIVSAWCDPKEFSQIENRDRRVRAWYKRLLELKITWHEDPRLREQDFGNYQVPEKVKQYKKERHRFGPFFYRFPQGESASDVFDRVSTFLDSLWRSFDLNKSRNYILVTHGIAIRVLLARYFRYTIDQFSMLANPRNCEMVILGHDGAGKLQLDGRCELQLDDNKETGETSVKGHKFHRRLRVLPRQYVHKVNVRISHDDDVGPSQMVGRQSVSHIQGRIIEANENGDEYMLSDLQRPPLSNGETTSL